MKDRGMFEVPPKGYRGSLKGTSWDPDVMNEPYFRGASVKAGEVNTDGHSRSGKP
jgi:hypothetical protein